MKKLLVLAFMASLFAFSAEQANAQNFFQRLFMHKPDSIVGYIDGIPAANKTFDGLEWKFAAQTADGNYVIIYCRDKNVYPMIIDFAKFKKYQCRVKVVAMREKRKYYLYTYKLE